MNKRKIGKFRISHIFIERTSQKTLSKIMSNFVPIKAESLYAMDAIEYTALSDLFEEVPWGTEIPFYNIEVTGTNVKVIKQ